MAHFHSHNHTEHSVNSPVRILYICLAINLIFVAAEAFAGWKSNSTGLLSDAGHNLSDALVSVSVAISGIIISTTGWNMIDPLLSLAVTIFIALPTIKLIHTALKTIRNS